MKSKSTVKTAKKTRPPAATRTRTRTPEAPAAGTPGGGARAARAKLALIERLQALGLLEQGAAQRLEHLAETVETDGKDGLSKAAAFDRELYTGLVAFEAQGGDGVAKKSLQPLVALTDALSGIPEGREGLAQALGALRKVVAFHGATLYVRNPDDRRVEPTAVLGFEVELVPRIRFSEGQGFSSWVATRKKPVLYSSLHRNEAPGTNNVRSFMSIPLVVGGDAVGVLNLGHRDDGAYGPADLRRLLVAGGVLAGLVQRFVATQQIRARETRNPVTGLATGTYFRNRLEEEVVRCRELGYAMSLVMLRLNELKELSGQFGNDFKERAQTEFCGLIAEWKVATELVGHTQDDLLIALLPGARAEHAQTRAEQLKDAVLKHNFPRRKKMTLGWGIATYPADAEDPQDLLACVDKALKEGARSRAPFEGVPQSMAA